LNIAEWLHSLELPQYEQLFIDQAITLEVLPSLTNIYVFSSPDGYNIFRASETLRDEKLDISFPLEEVFK